jgi:uncharacterized membrane protein YkoI
MGEYGDKAVVKIDADGSVLKCAKSLGGDECGFTPGAKVCGKCGAMPVQMKAMMEEDEEEMPEEEMTEDISSDEEMPAPAPKKKPVVAMGEEEEEEEEEEDEEEMPAPNDMEEMRARRLASMGMKSADVGRTGYLCAVDRKVYPGGTGVCDDCPGGCVSEKGMPGLLHVEGLAEDMFEGKVLDSGYSAEADMFVVDVQAKDGRAVEVFVDGTNGEVLGWHKLDQDAFEQKSLLDEMMLIDFNEAAEIAVKSIEGSVVAVEPDVFEGYDAYAVEIDGIDGKSYDVFVALDGEVLGYDKYEPEEAEDIEAEAAEIALKRAFTEDQRNAMAKEGNALPDGSYPIASKSDLQNAISAYGRAKDKDAAKRHIMKRAKELGAETMIPANWVAGGAEMSKKDDDSIEVADNSFMASLLEFELLNAEEDNNL